MYSTVPVLAIIYSPSDIGQLAVFTSKLLLPLPAISLRFKMAIPLVTLGSDAMALAYISVFTCTVMTFTYVCALLIFRGIRSEALTKLLDDHSWLFLLCLWVAGIFTLSKAHTI